MCQELVAQSAKESETFAAVLGDSGVLADGHQAAETQVRKCIFAASLQRLQESLGFVHIETALGFFFAGIHLEKDFKDFTLRCIGAVAGERRTDFLELFHGFDVCDGMDAVGDNRRLLELITLYRTNHVATHAATVEGRTRRRELEFSFLHTVFAKVGGTERNRIFHSLGRVELAHPHKLYRIAAAARNLTSFGNPCFESCKVLAHLFKCEFHSNSRKLDVGSRLQPGYYDLAFFSFFAAADFFSANSTLMISSMCLCVKILRPFFAGAGSSFTSFWLPAGR